MPCSTVCDQVYHFGHIYFQRSHLPSVSVSPIQFVMQMHPQIKQNFQDTGVLTPANVAGTLSTLSPQHHSQSISIWLLDTNNLSASATYSSLSVLSVSQHICLQHGLVWLSYISFMWLKLKMAVNEVEKGSILFRNTMKYYLSIFVSIYSCGKIREALVQLYSKLYFVALLSWFNIHFEMLLLELKNESNVSNSWHNQSLAIPNVLISQFLINVWKRNTIFISKSVASYWKFNQRTNS